MDHQAFHIEEVWACLKSYIKSLYNKIPASNYILYPREAEIRQNLKKLNDNEKEKEIKEIMEYLYEIVNYEL